MTQLNTDEVNSDGAMPELVLSANTNDSLNVKKTISDAPYYQSVKRVQALRIVEIKQTVDHHQALLVLEDLETGERYDDYQVSVEWIAKRGAEEGGVLVIYRDGYQSYCPLKEFDAGNIKLHTDAASNVLFGGVTPYAALRSQMLNDESFAYSWHCNIAVPLMDILAVDHNTANETATKLMNHLFKVDTHHPKK
jgi:hypothetical protein